jgi:hypothetical protein
MVQVWRGNKSRRRIGSPVPYPRRKIFVRKRRERRLAGDVDINNSKESTMRKFLLATVATCALAAPVLAEDVGVQVGPVGAGVTVGESHHDYDRDRVREKTVIKRDEPSDRTTVIKKERGDGVETKTIIRHDD